MVRLVTYSGEEHEERCDERSSRVCSVPDWRTHYRPNKLMLVPSVDSDLLMKSDNSEINCDGSVFRINRIKNIQDSASMSSLKSVHRTISEYWRDVLRYHWPIAIQSLFLVIVIITMGPWIGLTCNEDIPGNSEERSVVWRFPIISEIKTAFDYGQTEIPRPTCVHGYCCFSQNIEGSSIRRRASFLKRKRITKAFDAY